MIALDVLGPFPRLAGWLWYLLASWSGLLAGSTHISLYLTRIFLIKKVTVT
jgi:hypothetical protein